ncbi:hypothetical protein KEG38_23580 [Polyangium jinanense]|uniref:hypothetical protein n=1 Tax=Polyangium jinanense TaxID=2829994 RepID=UPI00234092A2|nr:hypothetical protein [Polyangium jinanense]MDC3956861.1 hypothetical protein [Polyangium jinanense]
MARPPRSHSASLAWFKVRVTDEEKKRIAAIAKKKGMTASDLFRAWLAAEETANAVVGSVATKCEQDSVATEWTANARARPGVAPQFRSRWSPRYVWTLHRVPGRLDDLPLAVKRRVLSDCDGMEVETPYGSMSVKREELAKNGVSRGLGALRTDDQYNPVSLDLAVLVYDRLPTREERAEWLRRRHLEQALLKSPPKHVWISRPGVRPGAPDQVTRCAARRAIGHVIGDCVYRYELEVRRPGEDWASETVDMMTLAVEGKARLGRGDDAETAYLKKPTADELRAAGAERARRAAEDARFKQRVGDFFDGFSSATAEPDPGLAALRELGLDGSATVDDVYRAYRARVKTEHPDKGGTGDMGQLVELRDRALAYLRARAV